jgi:hypothetical protein
MLLKCPLMSPSSLIHVVPERSSEVSAGRLPIALQMAARTVSSSPSPGTMISPPDNRRLVRPVSCLIACESVLPSSSTIILLKVEGGQRRQLAERPCVLKGRGSLACNRESSETAQFSQLGQRTIECSATNGLPTMVSAVITQDQLGQIGEATNGAQKTAVSAHIAAAPMRVQRVGADVGQLQRGERSQRRQRGPQGEPPRQGLAVD